MRVTAIHDFRIGVDARNKSGHDDGTEHSYAIGQSKYTLSRESNSQTRRACWTAAPMKDLNSGCGSKGRDFNSGWNCTPMNHG